VADALDLGPFKPIAVELPDCQALLLQGLDDDARNVNCKRSSNATPQPTDKNQN